MTDFVTFYLSGGFYNHLVTIGFAIAASSLVFHARAQGKAGTRWLRLADRALLGCIAIGLFGTLMGVIDACAVLVTLQPDQFQAAAARGAGIAVVTLAYALLGAIPLGIVGSVQRHRHSAV